MEAQSGDYVEVQLAKEIYRGVLLESPEPGIVLLKLDSGYNIGFKKKDLLGVKVIERFEKRKEKKFVLRRDPSKSDIAMILTGGTIASRYDPRTGGVDPLDNLENLFKFYPEIFEKVNVAKISAPFMKPSEEMDWRDWKTIARVVCDFLNDPSIKGVVITHGTDTLHYTSAALSFFLRDLNKPVVLTYSQRSVDRASSDANLNLQCAALMAISDVAEVMIVGHASLNDDFCYAMPGTKVRKLHSSKRDAFKVVNSSPLARVFTDRVEILSGFRKRSKGKVRLDAKFEDKVALVKIYPGQDPDILDFYLDKGYKGIVLEVFGLGHLPSFRSRANWARKLKQVIKKGLVVCAAAQTIYGRLDPFVYSTGRDLLKTGMIYLEDMLSETAFVKLGWVLGHKEWAKDMESVRAKMLENFAKELNPRLS